LGWLITAHIVEEVFIIKNLLPLVLYISDLLVERVFLLAIINSITLFALLHFLILHHIILHIVHLIPSWPSSILPYFSPLNSLLGIRIKWVLINLNKMWLWHWNHGHILILNVICFEITDLRIYPTFSFSFFHFSEEVFYFIFVIEVHLLIGFFILKFLGFFNFFLNFWLMLQ
jgi:hypothetical protein